MNGNAPSSWTEELTTRDAGLVAAMASVGSELAAERRGELVEAVRAEADALGWRRIFRGRELFAREWLT